MKEELDVIDLFARRDVALVGMASVVEAGVGVEPGETGEASAVDGVGQRAAGSGIEDAESAFFGTAGRGAVGDVFTVIGGKPPIEGDGSIGGELINVDEDAGLRRGGLRAHKEEADSGRRLLGDSFFTLPASWLLSGYCELLECLNKALIP